MKTKTINLYSFSELSEQAKKKALENLHNINVEYNEWHDFVIEDEVEELAKLGFEDAKISYSGFWSQGDGASFDAKINLEKFCTDKRILALANECSFRIEKNSYANHYSHKRTRYTEYDGIGSKRHVRINTALDELSKQIEEVRLSKCEEIYKRLEDSYDQLTSDASIIETIEANEYTFTENGKLEN